MLAFDGVGCGDEWKSWWSRCIPYVLEGTAVADVAVVGDDDDDDDDEGVCSEHFSAFRLKEK